jgi:AraC-like DNA-binding protein
MHRRNYHTVVHALESKTGLSGHDRFALAIRHAINGNLPHQRFVDAGLRSPAVKPDSLEARLKDWFATDLCPQVQLIRLMDKESSFVSLYNDYNQAMGTHALATLPGEKSRTGAPVMRRPEIGRNADPKSCWDAKQAAFDLMLSGVRHRSKQKKPRLHVLRVSELVRHLGLEKELTAEVAAFFENNPNASVSELARALNVHVRALERQLKTLGTTADSIRRASSLVKSIELLPTGKTLTEIASESGYSDQAHLAKAMRLAFGLSLGKQRKLLSA